MSQPTKRRYSLFPKQLAQCVEPLTRPVFRAKGLAGTRLITDWPQIVGENLAKRCFPEKISFPAQKTTDGTLTIAVQNGFAPEIQHLQPIILEKLATYFGYKAVSRIAISHSYPSRKISPHPSPLPNHSINPQMPPPNSPPIDLASVEDQELRSALASFADCLNINHL